MRILLTGATGLLGQNFLLEIIKQYYDNLHDLQIIILGRNNSKKNICDRIKIILQNDVADYINIPNIKLDLIDVLFNKVIKCINFSLDSPDLGINKEDLQKISNKKIDIVYHIASLTDFRNDSVTVNNLRKINIYGTKQLLLICNKLQIEKIVYISSAYVSGVISGKVAPDYSNHKANFRNEYEKTKLKAEILVKNYAEKREIDYQIFRPSTICGRLIEKTLGKVSKYDVFYGWAVFLLKNKIKLEKDIEKTAEINLRFKASHDSGLNIIPVDCVAKLLFLISTQKTKDKYFYLANSQETPHKLYFSIIIDMLHVKGVEMVDFIPKKKNRIEKLYYKTVGNIFNLYINCQKINFDLSNLEPFLKNNLLSIPEINEDNFRILMKYAIANNLGIKS